MDQYGTPEAPRVIESASATTSPDNAASGLVPYIVAVAGLLAIMLAFSTMASCTASALKGAYYLVQDDVATMDWEYLLGEGMDDYDPAHDHDLDYDHDLDLDDLDSLEELYRYLEELDARDSRGGRA